MASEIDSPPLTQVIDYQVIDFVHGPEEKTQRQRRIRLGRREKKDGSEIVPSHVEHADDVDFQKQLDKIALWFEKWSHAQRCYILEHLILIGNYNQFQLLWTAVQPVLSKDFMITAKDRFPNEQFAPLSTENSRATRERLIRNRQIQKYHREKSVYVRDEEDVRKQTGLFPHLNSVESVQKPMKFQLTNDSYLRLPALHRRKSLTNPTDHMDSGHEDPTANWRTTMQVRRHLQELSPEETKDAAPSSAPHAAALYSWYSDWGGPKRAAFLHLALMKLDARQLYFLSSYLFIRRHRDILGMLPSRLAHNILSYLSPEDISNCSKVSTDWRQLCHHNAVWRQKCNETRLELRPVCTPRVGGWRSAYKNDRMLKLNWKHGQCNRAVLLGHTDSVLCVAMNKKIIVSGGKDSTVRVWNISHGRLLHTFTGHQKGVWAVGVISDHLVASGSYDRTVKIWGIGSTQTGCLRTFFGHHGPIWALVCKKKFLASGSQDRLIKVWDVRHCTLQLTLAGHGSAIFALDADDDMSRVFSGSADRTIRVWSTSDGGCLKVIWTGETTSIMSVSYSKGFLACSSGGHVSVWNPGTGTRVRSFKAHKGRIETVRMRLDDSTAPSGIIITGGKDGRLKYWNVFGKDGGVNKLDEHKGQINALCADAARIVTASYDKTLIIWDFRDQLGPSRMSTR